MDYSFLRQLTLPLEQESMMAVYELLTKKGMELYVRTENLQFQMVQAMEEISAEDTILYLAAADRVEAVRLLEEAGLANVISEAIQPVGMDSELERAKDLYYKKRRNNMIAFGILLVIGFVYYIWKAISMY